MADDVRGRVIRLEVKVEEIRKDLEDTSKKVTEMHEVLLQAKGVKWVILIGASIVGFFSGLLAKMFPKMF